MTKKQNEPGMTAAARELYEGRELLDRWAHSIKALSGVAHMMGSPRTAAEARRNIVYVKQAIRSLETLLRALYRLVGQLAGSLEEPHD